VFKEKSAKELTKIIFYFKYSCLNLSLIDVITTWFSDKMLSA